MILASMVNTYQVECVHYALGFEYFSNDSGLVFTWHVQIFWILCDR